LFSGRETSTGHGYIVARAKPPLLRLSELTSGQHADFFALLSERARSSTRDGKPYYTCRFRDARRSATFMVWADTTWYEPCEREWREGQVYKIRGAYAEHEKFGPQLDIHNIRPINDGDRADGFDPFDLLEHSRYEAAAMLAELTGLAEVHIADGPLRRLVLTLLERHAAPLQCLPATLNKFYPFAGGLLEHTLAVTHTCLQLVGKYAAHYAELRPPLNRDLVVAGAILHDIGRVLEFGDDFLQTQPTVPGRLFGHLVLGRDLIRDTARELVPNQA
jgi:3'-5' exoribonuclease